MKERENTGSLGTRTMSIDRILERLSILKERSEGVRDEKDIEYPATAAEWDDEINALEAAIAMISALQDEGVCDLEALKDMIFDYDLADQQNKELHRKFEVADRAVRKDGVFHCPECNHRVAPNHTHCHWCGKQLGGW